MYIGTYVLVPKVVFKIVIDIILLTNRVRFNVFFVELPPPEVD